MNDEITHKEVLRVVLKSMGRPHKWTIKGKRQSLEEYVYQLRLRHNEYPILIRYGYSEDSILLLNVFFFLLPLPFMLCFARLKIETKDYSKIHYLWRWSEEGRYAAKQARNIVEYNKKTDVESFYYGFLTRNF